MMKDKQMKSLNKYIISLVFVGMLPALSYAQQYTAVETAKTGVESLLDTVQASRTLFLSDRDAYFAAVEGALSSIVDFTAVAEVVMNRFAASASDAQKQRFADILKNTLNNIVQID